MSQNFSKIVVAVLGIFFGIFLVMNILTGQVNALGKFYLFLSVGGLIVGLILPKPMFYVLVVTSGYLDFFKRLLVVGGNTYWTDVLWVLAISPMILLGIGCAVLAKFILRPGVGLNKRGVKLFLVSMVIFGLYLLESLVRGFDVRDIQVLANGGGYASLIFVVPALFPTVEEQRKLIRFTILMFIPVAFYGIHQVVYGFAQFEVDYLLTGLSSEYRVLMESRIGLKRAFATLNSSQNLGKMMAICGVMVTSFLIKRHGDRQGLGRSIFWLSVGILFFIVSYLSGTRTGLISGVFAIIAFFVLQRRWATYIVTSSVTVLLVVLIIASPKLRQEKAVNELGGEMQTEGMSTRMKVFLSFGTFNVRLESMSHLTQDLEIWTPFGYRLAHGKSRPEHWKVHDIFTDTLIKVGYIPIVIGGALLAFMMIKTMNFIWGLPNVYLRKLVFLELAQVVGILGGAFSATANLRTFPVSMYFFLFIGLVVSQVAILREAVSQQKQAGGTGQARAW